MIDIHCHVVPEADDGAPSMEEALEMIRQAADQGVHTIIATPHHGDGRYDNPAASVREKVQALNERIGKNRIPLKVLPGQEIHVTRELIKDFDRGRLLTLADSNYILLELPVRMDFSPFLEMIHELAIRDLRPVLAHPERHPELMRDKGKIVEFMARGGLIQITSHSITGQFGGEARKNAQKLLQRDVVHFVASDAHGSRHRRCNLAEVHAGLVSRHGSELSERLQKNARFLIHNLMIPPVVTEEKKRKWARFI